MIHNLTLNQENQSKYLLEPTTLKRKPNKTAEMVPLLWSPSPKPQLCYPQNIYTIIPPTVSFSIWADAILNYNQHNCNSRLEYYKRCC